MSVNSSLPDHRPGGVGGALPRVCQGEPFQTSYTVNQKPACGRHLVLSFKETFIPFQLEGKSLEKKWHVAQHDGQLWIDKVTTAGEVTQSSATCLSEDTLTCFQRCCPEVIIRMCTGLDNGAGFLSSVRSKRVGNRRLQPAAAALDGSSENSATADDLPRF